MAYVAKPSGDRWAVVDKLTGHVARHTDTKRGASVSAAHRNRQAREASQLRRPK